MAKDYLKHLLDCYYPIHFFALFRAHELYHIEPFLPYLSAPILDLGCGDGIIATMLFDCPLAYGIDPSRVAVRQARQRNAYTTVFLGDAHAIPLPDNHLGGVFSNSVLEHIPNLSGVIAEVARVLRSGAYFVATCLTPWYYALNPIFQAFDRFPLRWLRRRMIAAEDQLHNHVSLCDEAQYRRMFADHGMTLALHQYYGTAAIARFCYRWDTASKYRVPYPVKLTHGGLLSRYLKLRYAIFARKEVVLQRWYHDFYRLCYDRNEANAVGVAQILVAQKL